MFGKFLDYLESFQMVLKVADGLKSFQMIWKDSRWSGKFLDGLESFQIVWKVSGLSEKISGLPGKFLDCLENVRNYGKFTDCLEGFQIV